MNWGAFNPNNLKGKYLDSLRNDIYAGFKTKSVPKYEMRGAGRDGRRSVQTGYSQQFDANYYKEHEGWRGIGDKLGLNINSQNDVRQLYDYVNGYKPPAPAAPTPTAAPVAKAPSISFNQEVAQINSQYQAENKRLTDLISSQNKAYNDQAAAFDKRFSQQQDSFDSSINNLNNRVANASNAYDPTKNMGSSNNINPALSIQEKNKSLSSGTQRYNRNSGLNIKNVSL
jgi:hypothetical protein